ncbi:MAG TPA: UDP-2,3-diacylglucosamine diphosphatase [Burkholderiaceae bacterium]|nr:UDP-2,3-diacylglucosamine diphosphatase [Burkholderiaceae bacterium]
MSSKSPDAAIARFEAPAAWRAIDLISDLHLAADHPRTFDAWRRHLLHTPADAVFILGDLFELWVGDDSRVEGFERECAQVLIQAGQRRPLAFMPGNRDFMVGDEMLADCGATRLHDPTLLSAWGSQWLLTHGDALCLDDIDYQRFRTKVRDPAWQQAVLARPLAERRSIASGMRHASEAMKATGGPWVDIDQDAAVAWLRASGSNVMIHGHTHQPGDSEIAPGFLRHVLSDWDLDSPQPRAEVLRFTPTGLRRLGLQEALSGTAC